MRRNGYHPKPIKTKGNMTLYKGPFGYVFGGTEPGLVFEPYVLNGLVQARQQTLRKKPGPLMNDVSVTTRKIVERHAKATVVMKTRDNIECDQSNLGNKLIGIIITRVSMRVTSAVGRTKVDNENH